MGTIKEQHQLLSRIEGKELQYYMKQYAERSKTIDQKTHLAMLDILNTLQLELNHELHDWKDLVDNNSEKMRNLQRYDFYAWIENQQDPVIAAIDIVEEQYNKKYPNEKPLEELLPQWYS